MGTNHIVIIIAEVDTIIVTITITTDQVMEIVDIQVVTVTVLAVIMDIVVTTVVTTVVYTTRQEEEVDMVSTKTLGAINTKVDTVITIDDH